MTTPDPSTDPTETSSAADPPAGAGGGPDAVEGADSPALDAPALRRVVAVLSLSQIVSWGCLYYGFAALQSSVIADTGWSPAQVTGAFSLAQLVSAGAGVWAGRHLDRYGPRRLMTTAAVLAAPGLVAVASAASLPVFYLGWLVVGVAMAGTLYPPAFAALTHWGGTRRVWALTTVTLAGGLASTLFAPLAALVDAWLGWRAAFMTLAVVAFVVTVPLHWFGLAPPWRARPTATASPHPAGAAAEETPSSLRVDVAVEDRRPVARSGPFVALAAVNTVMALATFAVVINLVPMLREQGLDGPTAALVLGLGGVGQVVGRLGYTRFSAVTNSTSRLLIVVASVAVLTAALALAPAITSLVVSLSVVLGLARGAYTLVQATAVTERWGPSAYGHLNGLLTAPALAASAASPFVGAVLAQLTGSYANAFLILAALAAAALLAVPLTRVPGAGSPAATT